jgi:hypothetical protein
MDAPIAPEVVGVVDRTRQEEKTMNDAIRSSELGIKPRGWLAALTCLLLVALASALAPGQASALTGIQEFEMYPSTTQAGGHPNVTMYVKYLNRSNAPADEPCFCDDPKTVTFHFPTGFIGDPHSQQICSLAEFALAHCPISSQVGRVAAQFRGLPITLPLFNLETHPDQAGQLGYIFPVIVFPNFIDLSSRTESDYGLDSASFPMPHPTVFNALQVDIWGVPSLPENDFYRFKSPLTGFGSCGAFGPCGNGNVSGVSSPAPPRPYLLNPTTCGVPLTASVDVVYYSGQEYHQETPWPSTTGCTQLAFNPSMSVSPTTTEADTASGIDMDLKAPQTPSPYTPSPSEIRTSRTVFPPGFTLNPSAADGKVACLASETGIGTRGPAHCPEASKIGTLSLDIAALPGPIPGALYLGEPLPGEKYRIVLAANGYATHVKLTGTVATDPSSGRVTVELKDLPQAPMQRFNLHIFGSERGLMATPTKCGTYSVRSEFIPWDNVLPKQESTSSFTIDSGPEGAPCPGATRPFSPSFEAGSTNPTAGRFTPFSLRVQRPDGDQELAGLTVKTPPGLLASLRGIPYCPEAAISQLMQPGYSGLAELAAPSCPAASEVGSVVVGAGAGTHPVYTRGKAYLAGPYKGAPLSLIVDVPAVSGPYDLGNVTDRIALRVDPETAAISAISDPLPQILEGTLLRTRSIQLSFDRPGFTINPTDCSGASVAASLLGDEGAMAAVSRHFQVASCATLKFEPKLTLSLKGGSKRTQHPALRAVLRTAPGEANIARIGVTLPNSELLDQAHIKTICTRAQYAAEACPDGSVYGHATAFTPLLDQPLTGPVYLRSSSHKLPDLVVALRGQINVDLVGRIDSPHGRLRTRFASVPDAPVSKFVLQLEGGKKGLLVNERGVCASGNRAKVSMKGQNEKVTSGRVRLRANCRGKHRRHQSHARHGRVSRPGRGR